MEAETCRSGGSQVRLGEGVSGRERADGEERRDREVGCCAPGLLKKLEDHDWLVGGRGEEEKSLEVRGARWHRAWSALLRTLTEF